MLKKLYPYAFVESVFCIDYKKLYKMGFRGLMFDIDNTLVHHGDDSTKEIDDLFKKIKKIGFKTVLLSNNTEERVKRKYTQYKGEESIESIRENLIQRDKFHEESGFYKTFENTTILDVTDCKSAKESAELLLKTINY